jgi:hypothetical protein
LSERQRAELVALIPARKRLCEMCGKRGPARKRPAHEAARDLPYEFYVEINGGEDCGICGRPRKPERKHHRHHEHKGEGFPLGLLCHMCNRVIGHRLMMASGGDVLGWRGRWSRSTRARGGSAGGRLRLRSRSGGHGRAQAVRWRLRAVVDG